MRPLYVIRGFAVAGTIVAAIVAVGALIQAQFVIMGTAVVGGWLAIYVGGRVHRSISESEAQERKDAADGE